MSRNKFEIPKKILESLKKETERCFGYLINSNVRYEQLCDNIFEKCSVKISSRTIYRLYTSKDSDITPSKHTLNLLAIYCGYKSIEEYSKLYVDEVSFNMYSELDILKDIYNISYNSSSLQYRDPALFSITKTLVKKLRNKGNYRDALIREYSKHPLAQNYFIEQFVDYDSLNHFYGKAIEIYLSSKDDLEAQIFGNCMLYLKAFLSKDEKECVYFHQKINAIKLDVQIHPFVIGRYFACNLLHEHFYTKSSTATIIDELLTIEKYIPRNGDSYVNFPCFHFIVCDALIKCKEYEVCLQLLNNAIVDYPHGKNNVDTGFYNAFDLFFAICYHHTGNSVKRDAHLKICKNQTYNFLSEKYYSIQQTLLELEIEKSKITRNRMRNKIQDLITQTGFVFFND